MTTLAKDADRTIEAQRKTIRVLARRLERQISDDVSGHALFEQNLSLENVVATRTRELEERQVALEDALTELRATQSELLQAQKLQAMGSLASGLAHEINTPTQYVMDNLQFIQDSVHDLLEILATITDALDTEDHDSSAGTRRAIEHALESSDHEFLRDELPRSLADSSGGLDRIADIVGAMRGFAHPGPESAGPVEIRELVESSVTVTRHEWKEFADVELRLDPSLTTVSGLRVELGQVLLNLLVNAAHALKEGGATHEARGRVAIETARDGDWATIVVRDSGCGMPPDVRERIFEPFFTTKDVGSGSGQGLAIAYDVITVKHGGELTVESEEGRGTAFTIRLPL